MTISHFSFPTTVHFGPGASKMAGVHLRDRKLRRPLVVTDKALAALPVTRHFLSHLDTGLDVGIYHGVQGNPTAAQVMAGRDAYKAHRADCVIGFGGGAALDVAKVVALMAVHDGDVMEYVWDHPKVRPVVNELPYLVAVPTTSGTGSEVGRSSVVSDDTTHVKRVVFSPKLLARVVFADPELTFDLPPAVTAATGMDALTHNIESFLSPAYHPLCDGIALEGVRIGARALAAAVRNGRDLPARADMMMSSMMGAIAFQKDLGAVHSCAHALGAICDLHHGLANALMLEPVMRFNLDAAEGKFAELAHVVGAKGPADFIRWLTDLKRGIGIAPSLSAVGVKKEQIAPMVDIAEKDICHQTNPRPCTRADFARFFEQAL
ncbi:MAG: iron-containing alcohol dehydrogenase [Burkholderiaceae bacterium]|jgi:alcohol dehydrogenase class IV|nr:iron-containing alcohol dehydrogenase [Burkholderiaceae bacterium]